MAHVEIFKARPTVPSFWRRVADQIRGYWSGPLTSSSPELARLWAGPPTSTGIAVTEQNGLTYSAVWAAVTLISSQVASLPLILYKRLPNGGKDRLTSHRLYALLHDAPNSEMTSMVFRETLQAHVLTWGGGYAEIERDNADRPIALWPMTPNRVTPVRDKRTKQLMYEIQNPDGGTPAFLDPHFVLHVPGLSFDGTVGYGIVAKARESIGLGLALERFGGTFFGNGSTFGGVLKTPNKLSENARKHVRASIEAQHQGLDRAHRFMLLEEGLDYVRLGVPPEDGQFIESRKFQIPEICRWFNLPPHKLRDLERATFSNIEQQAIEFVTDTLRPWLVKWEQEINRKLILPLERNIQFVEHLVDGLLRGDIQSRYNAYKVGREGGWLSADDILELENRNPLPDGKGKIYLVPANMVPVDDVVAASDDGKVKPTPSADRVLLPPPQVIAASRALFVDTMGRMVRRETDRARRADATPEKLRSHLDTFYASYEDLCVDALLPAVRTHLAWKQGAQDAAVYTRPVVRAHIAESVRQLRAVADAHIGGSPAFTADLERLCQRWETERADVFADVMLRETAGPVEPVNVDAMKKLDERQRQLNAALAPTTLEMNLEVARQKRVAAEMKKRRLERESNARVNALLHGKK